MAIARNISINNETYELEPSKGQRVYVGTCSTAAATNPKVCTVEDFPVDGNGEPYAGTEIVVKFTATNSSTSTTPQLNVNGTGAIRIWYNNAVLASAKSAFAGYANRYMRYVYDGTYWVFMGHSVDNNSTYSNVALGQGYAVQNNSAASATITATLGSYALTANGIVSVKFLYDVPANATLNINGKGAKAIYNKDAAITAGVIKAGDTATFVYSTYYHLIAVDSWQDKQDAISDLATIRSGAAAGATALQSHQTLKTINGQSLVGNGNITVVGEKGDKGDTGNVTVTDGVAQITIVNDLNTGGTGDALSAEMGKYLGQTALVGMGTFAQAYVKSQSNHDLWCWMLNDMVDGEVTRKPIWHVGSSTFVDAVGSVVSIAIAPPAEPVFSLDDSEDVLSGSTLNVTFFGTLHYIIDGGTEQTTSTSPLALTLNADTDIEAWVEDSIGLLSQHVTKSYSIAIDHKFVFKIKLSGDNSTEYVPVSHQPVPGFSSNAYTMSVDWGDGTVDNFTNKAFSQKECSHAYTGATGDEKTITLRGSAIPALYFAESASGVAASNYGNNEALVAILENTLECDTYITINGGCSSLSADALSNNVGTGHLHLNGIASFPTGLLNHLSKTGITNFANMFNTSEAIFTAENMQELRTSLASATFMQSMFYGFKGTCPLPNNLFDLIGSGVVTNVWALTHTAKSGLTGDAKALYDVLSTKVTSSASTAYCFSPVSLTNRNQVPNAWGGTAG